MNNKARGNAVEREFARKISKWLTGGEDELVCWRVQDSGSVATNAIKRGQKYKESGDLRAIDSRFAPFFDRFHIDTKAIKDVNLFITADNLKSNQLYQEWIKTVADAEKNGKIPMMPVKWTGKRYQFIVYPAQVTTHLKDTVVTACFDSANQLEFMIQELGSFFALNDYKTLLAKNPNPYWKKCGYCKGEGGKDSNGSIYECNHCKGSGYEKDNDKST